MSEHIFLSRRNLLTLLSKLDRAKNGESTACTIIKFQNPADPFVQTMDSIAVTAVEDDEYYTTRGAGSVHPKDEPKPDVHTRDAPTPDEVVLDFDTIGGHPHQPEVAGPFLRGPQALFVGKEFGQEVRRFFNLDALDSAPTQVVFLIPATTYSVSMSFFRGLLEKSILAAGSKEAFEKKFKFAMNPELFPSLNAVVYQTITLTRLDP